MAEFSERGVILCRCHGRVSDALPMDEIRQFLEQRQPGLHVVIEDDLCRPEVLSSVIEEHGLRPMVIGACSQLSLKLPFWEETGESIIDPYSIRVVDLIGEIKSQSDPADLLSRTKLILGAQLARQEEFSGTPPQAVKLQFARLQGKTSRRDFFKRLMPQYQVIPYIQRDRCVGEERCGICQKSCPFNAIVLEEQLSIDKTRCRGCGVCTAICPYQAINYPTFSFDQLDREMEGLLLADGDMLEPRIIAVACQSCLSSSGDTNMIRSNYMPNVFCVEVPCLDMALPWLVLRAFDRGAQGVVLISNKEGCQFGLDCRQWQEKVQFVQQLLEQWGVDPSRLKSFEDSELEQWLAQFTRDIAQLPGTLPRLAQPTIVPDSALPLPSLVSGMTEKLAPLSGGVVSTGNVFFGKLELDISRCTACGLCVLHCPTEALSFSSDENLYRLFFYPQSCVGCGQCVDMCPEKCLGLESILELDRLSSPAEAIFESKIARCKECGEPMVPAAMTDKLRERLSRVGGITSHLDICPACKLKAVSGVSASVIGV